MYTIHIYTLILQPCASINPPAVFTYL